LAARVNNVAVFTEIIGTVVFGVLLFVLWAAKTKPSPYGASILTNTTATLHNPAIYAFALAGLMGAFTLVGFELAADMSEDAVKPRQSVPRGVIWAVAGSAVLGMIALIGFTVAIPSIKAVETPGLPLLTIAGYWLPSWLVKVFIAFVIFSMFAILVVGAGAQARLAYSMARDNMLPFSASCGRSTRAPRPRSLRCWFLPSWTLALPGTAICRPARSPPWWARPPSSRTSSTSSSRPVTPTSGGRWTRSQAHSAWVAGPDP
jgi:amino acid transporter